MAAAAAAVSSAAPAYKVPVETVAVVLVGQLPRRGQLEPQTRAAVAAVLARKA